MPFVELKDAVRRALVYLKCLTRFLQAGSDKVKHECRWIKKKSGRTFKVKKDSLKLNYSKYAGHSE